MKKTFSLEIKSPCDENIKDMKPNANGFFCDSCVKNVIDLSTKTNSEVASFIAKNKNNTSICARLKTTQLEEQFEYNELSKVQNFKYAAAIAATVLLASPIIAQKNNIPVITKENKLPATGGNCPMPEKEIMGKIAYVPSPVKMISIVIKGTILDINTKKALSNQQFPNLNMFITGSNNNIIVNPKTGAFSIPISIDEKTTQLHLSLTSGDLYFSKTVTIDVSKIKNNTQKQTIYINSKEFSQLHIAGGLGVNYIDNKKRNI